MQFTAGYCFLSFLCPRRSCHESVVDDMFCAWLADGQMDSWSGSLSPSNSVSSPSGSMPPGGLFGQSQQQTATFPHLKGQDEPSENITSMNEKVYEGIDCADLVEQLKDTDTLHEQADIIHYLYTTKYALSHLIRHCATSQQSSVFLSWNVNFNMVFSVWS